MDHLGRVGNPLQASLSTGLDFGPKDPPSSPAASHASSTENSNNSNHEDEASRKRRERESQGQCPSCGQQLFRITSTASSKSIICCLPRRRNKDNAAAAMVMDNQHKEPLSIPNLVDRGQCLHCIGNASIHHTDDSFSLPSNPSAASANNHSNNSSFSSLLGGETNTMTSPRLSPSEIPPGTAVYYGEYNVQGAKHGQGEMLWSNGDIYKGEFANNARHGHGTLTFGSKSADGTTQDAGEYVGDWVNNEMHGSGTRRFPSGDVYMGPYHHGHRHGAEGRFYYANGDMYWGSWKNNLMHGPGRYYYASGQRFEGAFRHSKRTGVGKLQRTDGTMEIFQYVNDQRVGQGVRWSTDRTRAWRLWLPSGAAAASAARTGTSRVLPTMEKKRIPIAEAVSLVYEMETAAAEYEQEEGRGCS